MRESAIQRRLLDKIEEIDAVYVRKIAQSIYSHGGVPDIVGCIGGLWFSIEVKTNKGKLSKLQEREGKLIEEAGGIFLVCYGEKDIEYVLSILRHAALYAPN